VTGKIIGQDRMTGNVAIVILDFADLEVAVDMSKQTESDGYAKPRV
jgi:hypothetical protein